MPHNSPLLLKLDSDMSQMSPTGLLHDWLPSIFINWQSQLPYLLKEASTKMQPNAVRPSSTERESAPAATFLPSTPNRDGTCTLPARFVWTASRRTALLTSVTGLRP